MSRSLEGRNALITGASQGLGRAIGGAYVAAGASVLLCARNETALLDARADIAAHAGPEQSVHAEAGDVSNVADVDRIVGRALEVFSQVHILVNNAGIYGPLGSIENVEWGEWTRAIEVNLYGSVLPSRALLPHFKTHGYGKIVQLSGGGATSPLPHISAYAASKAAVVRFAETLAEEVRDDGVDVNSIAPGALNTRLLDQVLAAGPVAVGQTFYDRSVDQRARGGTPLETGADLAVYLGSAASDGITGKLFSAVWDPWAEMANHREDLSSSDVYTLRRIVPKDRGLSWGAD